MPKCDKPSAPVDWFFYEKQCAARGFRSICGVDEAGRGPLAGPVYAAAVIFKDGEHIDGLNDSKKLSEKKRELLFDIITERAAAYCVARAEVEEIERLNILGAVFVAMNRAIDGLQIPADFALIDGDRFGGGKLPFETVIGGDAKSESIAAASVLAKVSRDRYMKQIAAQYPQYNFEKHKGYGTREHAELIRKFGPCPIHRSLFIRKIIGAQGQSDGAPRE